MRTTSLVCIGLAFGSLALTACRDSSNNNNPDGKLGTDGAGDIHIQDVQNDAMPPNTPVSLHGVVVTAVDTYGSRTGDFWVEEVGGGERSGVKVHNAPVSAVTALMPGDVVDISGAIKTEFALNTDTSGLTETELVPASGGMIMVNKTGTGTVPDAHALDALAIGQMAVADQQKELEKWEGVFVSFANVSALNRPACGKDGSGNPNPPSACTDNAYFKVTGQLEIDSSLSAFATTGTGTSTAFVVNSGDCLSSITGVLGYFFNYQVLPRATADVMKASGTSSCPQPENNATVCADGIDNDGNGFKDCMDNACVVGAPACRMTSDITTVQATTPTGPVELDNVYVTGIAHNKRSFWVSTNPTAAVNQGLYVFNNSSNALDTAVVPGSKVTIIGKVTEYNDDTAGGTLTEITPLSLTFDNTTPATIVPVTGQTAANLMMAANAPMYESVLVTLQNVNISALGAAANGYIATAKQSTALGGQQFGMSSDIIQLASGDLGCYTSITGYWTNLMAPSSTATTKPNAFGFIPLTLGAKAASATLCN